MKDNEAQEIDRPEVDTVKTGESEREPAPVAENPQSEDAEASKEGESTVDPISADPSTSDELPATKETVEVVDLVVAADTASSTVADAVSQPKDAAKPLEEDKLDDTMCTTAEDIAEDCATGASSVEELQLEQGTVDGDELAITDVTHEVAARCHLDSAEILPTAPDPPSHSDDAPFSEESGEKKVQFAPGTPEPKPTQRRKKNGKVAKSRKSRRPPPSSDDQDSTDDIVAIIEGPFDAPAPDQEDSVIAYPVVVGGEQGEPATLLGASIEEIPVTSMEEPVSAATREAAYKDDSNAIEPESVDDKNNTPDSAIELEKELPWSDSVETKNEAADDLIEAIIDDKPSEDESPQQVKETMPIIDKLASSINDSDAEAEPQSSIPAAEFENPAMQADEVPLPSNEIDGSRDSLSQDSEFATSRCPIEAVEELQSEVVVRERAPSIEQISNVTEIGDDEEGEDEKTASSSSRDDDCFEEESAGVETAEAPAALTVVTETDPVQTMDTNDMDVEENSIETGAEAVEVTITVLPEVATEIPEDPSISDVPDAEITIEEDVAELGDSADTIDIDSDIDASHDVNTTEESPLPQDQTEGFVQMSEDTDVECGDIATIVSEAEPEPVDTASSAILILPGDVPSVGEDSRASGEPDPWPADHDVQDLVAEAVPEQAQSEAVSEQPVGEDLPATAAIEVLPGPLLDAEPVVIELEVSEDFEQEVADAGVSVDRPDEEATEEVPPPPPESTEQLQPLAMEEPAPVIASVPDAKPSDPPSPKLSRSSGSRSKRERYQVRPSKKHAQDSSKPRHKNFNKDHYDRTPEETAERRQRKDARRVAEASRRLKEERRRFEEEEMKRMRHEIRRAARKAAAAEVERLAREEAEAVARREAERLHRKRRESGMRPVERRESGARSREGGESKLSGGLLSTGGGKNEAKPGFLSRRTDSGESSRAKKSRDGGDAERSRRASLPTNDENFENPDLRDNGPKSTSHDDGSSKKRRRHRSEAERAEPRKRESGEWRRDGERRGGGEHKQRSSKPKGFFGSHFAKF